MNRGRPRDTQCSYLREWGGTLMGVRNRWHLILFFISALRRHLGSGGVVNVGIKCSSNSFEDGIQVCLRSLNTSDKQNLRTQALVSTQHCYTHFTAPIPQYSINSKPCSQIPWHYFRCQPPAECASPALSTQPMQVQYNLAKVGLTLMWISLNLPNHHRLYV